MEKAPLKATSIVISEGNSLRGFLKRTPSWPRFQENVRSLNTWICTRTDEEKMLFLLVHKILFSKRLLVDHVEVLEICLEEFNMERTKSTEYFQMFLNSSVFSPAAIIGSCLVPRRWVLTNILLGAFAGITSISLGVRIVKIVQNRVIENRLQEMLLILEKFCDCINRNISYFNEISVMNSAKKKDIIGSRQTEQIIGCISSIKEVTEILYDATRMLEEGYELPLRLGGIYLPMEELRECDYFRRNINEFTAKNIKDFFNVFAYVQSQFLLRLSLNILANNANKFLDEGLKLLNENLGKRVLKEEYQFKQLTLDIKRKRLDELSLCHLQLGQLSTRHRPISILTESSLKLSACIMAVAEETLKLDEILHEFSLDVSRSQQKNVKKSKETQNYEEGCNLIEIGNCIRTVDSSLSICCDSFQRLMIVYNKFLGIKLTSDEKGINVNEELNSHFESDEKLTLKELNKDDESFDDFYAYMLDENSPVDKNESDKVNEISYESQLLNIEENITRKRFKPVLHQLKGKINPIRKEMLEKERKILEAKGFDVDKLFEKDTLKEIEDANEDNKFDDTQSSHDDDDDSIEEIMKPQKKTDNYEEMRRFLAEKQEINLFTLQQPKENLVSEDILE